jgi:UDP-GlcNAc:undecaprenyl-phosphate/decaprenyl-phosphate GlcNAc-1-phosphate transferase
MFWLVVGAVVPSFSIALVAGFVMRRLAPRIGLVDRPGERKVHTQTTPLGGGLAIWFGVVGSFSLGQIALDRMPVVEMPADSSAPRPANESLPRTLGELRSFVAPHVGGLRTRAADLWILLAAATGMMLLGLADDWRGLDWRLRLAVQGGIAAAIVFGKDWGLTLFIDAPALTAALSVLWIVGLVNSFNMLDNMDGLSAGVAAIAAVLLAAVILLAPDPTTSGPQLFVAGFLFVLAGALGGFLWHNRPPARLFMGDAGSYFVGFCLGVATLLATFAGGTLPRHAILAPLCVLAVPLYDMASVVWIRLRAGRSPFVGDKSHFSHRLVELGFSKTQAVLTIYLASAVCGLAALGLHRVDRAGAVVIGLTVLGVLCLIAILETTARRRIDG